MVVNRNWTINGRFLSQSLTGVQRYGWEIVTALDELLAEGGRNTADLTITLAAPPGCEPSSSLKSVRFVTAPGGSGHAWEQIALPRAVQGGLLSLCNTGPLTVRKQIVCIHDMNTRLAPDSYSRAFRALYRILLPALGFSAARVATVSHFAAEQLAHFGVASNNKIFVAPDGHEHALRWTPAHSATTSAAAGPDTVVVIGSRAPHKNIDLIFELARAMAPDGVRFALCGGLDSRVHAQGATASADNVVLLGRVSDDELAALLRDSCCLAFPSFTEGFGLPPLEAMARGCPVVSSDRASMPEICGDAALYASPTSVADWRAAILRLRDDAELRQGCIARGRERLPQFSWRRTAELYLEQMAAIDGRASQRSRAAAA
ncbi:glycosyltransferase family 4 protein [Alsobacter metallidurans]|uniref:glycosyltransferase family 4 protein n=1 Tax=Alsobacter metallidurans TaxID=340221 RepID=UPI0027E4BADF|nr:glycosyltransferase family 1 protein [Alsobacter metallidurans]